jgi:hypothetical protein
MARGCQATCRRRIDPVQFMQAGLGRAFERLWPKARRFLLLTCAEVLDRPL